MKLQRVSPTSNSAEALVGQEPTCSFPPHGSPDILLVESWRRRPSVPPGDQRWPSCHAWLSQGLDSLVSVLARSNPRVVLGVVKFDQAFRLPLQGYLHPCLKLPPPPATAICYAEYLLRTRQR